MQAASHPPTPVARDAKRGLPAVVMSEMWGALAISVIWLAVLFDAIFGPDFVSRSAGGDATTIPSVIVVAPFAYLATRVVARYAFDERHQNDD